MRFRIRFGRRRGAVGDAVRTIGRAVLLAAVLLGSNSAWSETAAGKYNVLFIAVDDLRPSLGCYGDSLAVTPNIDSLASSGTLFQRAYCQQAVCSPSRTSLMTGRRPDTTQIYDLVTHFRGTIPDAVTLSQHFIANGYHAESYGKIYHSGLDDPASWSGKQQGGGSAPTTGSAVAAAAPGKKAGRKAGKGKKGTGEKPVVDAKSGVVLKRVKAKGVVKGLSWESRDVADGELPDGQTADRGIETLQRVKDQPFFLALGFIKPHLPFIAPKKYFDLHPAGKFQLPSNPEPPKNVPPLALTDWGELRGYSDIPDTETLTSEKILDLIRGYYAAGSYTDAQIGRVLGELERLGLREKTIVILWGDHGWQLGEHGLWCKHTNFELATRAPLIISVPGQPNAGAKSPALVEFVDIYPSLVELCGLPQPEGLEGISFAPLLAEPNRPWKRAAFSQYPRQGKVMGYSMRTETHRYTEWKENESGRVVATELYDHVKDPQENVNLAGSAEAAAVTAELSRKLAEGWKGALPKRTGE